MTRGKIGLIEPRDELRQQVCASMQERGIPTEPYGNFDALARAGARANYAVLVNDRSVGALDVHERLAREGRWLAVIGYSDRFDPRRMVSVLRGGAYDYFSLPLDTVALASSLAGLDGGGSPYAAARMRAAQSRLRIGRLSPRERQVLENMAKGHSNKAIGKRLGISPRTVEIHRANMLGKLDARSSIEALRRFLEVALLEGPASRPGR